MSEQGWHARVSDAVGDCGAGFLVDDRHVLTCAHVVDGLANPRVGFPVAGVADVPATVVYRGPYDPDGGPAWRGDVAVVELPEPVDIRPAKFAPLRTLERGEGGLRIYGFPRGHQVDGVPADVSARAQPRLGGQACVLKAAPGDEGRLAPGFSGAAVFLGSTGEVVGMVIGHDRAWPGDGLMFPTEVLAGHWSVADFVTLGPFSAVAYRELVALLADVGEVTPLHLYTAVMERHVGGPSPPLMKTAQDVAECLATLSIAEAYKRRQYVGDLLHDLYQKADAPLRERIKAWDDRYVWAEGEVPPGERHRVPPEVTSVMVQITPSGAGNRTDVTISKLGGPGDYGGPPLRKPVPDKRVQETVEQEIGAFIESVPADRALMIEFVLPRRRLTEPVESWHVAPDDETQLGWRYPVVVRDLGRFLEDQPTRAYRLRAAKVPQAPLHWARCQDLRVTGRFAAWLSDENRVAIALATGPDQPEPVDQAFKAGIPVMLWPRGPAPAHEDDPDGTSCIGRDFRRAIEAGLNDGQIDSLPVRLKELRREAGESEMEHCARAVTLLWDDPDRRPAQPPLGLAE